MTKKIFFLLISFVLIFPFSALAETTTDDTAKDLLQRVGNTAGYSVEPGSGNDLMSLIGTIVSTALSLLGMIFVILMVYAGYHWLTAAGDQAKVDKAKDTILRAIIGLIIVVSAAAIYAFINQFFLNK